MINKKTMFPNLLIQNDRQISETVNNWDDKNIQMFLIKNYYYVLYRNIYFTINKVKYIPLETEDILSEFIKDCPKLIRKYQYMENSKFSSFLSAVVKNFALSRIKYWSAKKRIHNMNMISNEDLFYIKDNDSESQFLSKIDEIDINDFYSKLDNKTRKELDIIINNDKFYSSQKINCYRENVLNKINDFYNINAKIF